MNSKDFDDFDTVIYGHDMKDGSMFQNLHNYEDSQYLREHPEIYIYTPDKKLTYRIFAAVVYGEEHILKTYDFTDTGRRQQYIDSIYNCRDMQSSFDVRAFQYMIKPVQFEEFESKFNAARKYLEKDDKNRVVLKIDEDNVVFFTNEIYYIEKEKSSKQFLVYLEDKCVVAKGVLSAIENQLLEQHFMRTHRSYLVNMKHIRRIQKNDLVLSNGNLVPISRRKEKELKQQFMRYAILER